MYTADCKSKLMPIFKLALTARTWPCTLLTLGENTTFFTILGGVDIDSMRQVYNRSNACRKKQ